MSEGFISQSVIIGASQTGMSMLRCISSESLSNDEVGWRYLVDQGRGFCLSRSGGKDEPLMIGTGSRDQERLNKRFIQLDFPDFNVRNLLASNQTPRMVRYYDNWVSAYITRMKICPCIILSGEKTSTKAWHKIKKVGMYSMKPLSIEAKGGVWHLVIDTATRLPGVSL
ncbi:uncharacterized protein LY89DRAFT_293004 [Mollisia scopiformis]|uniref:Uncharacterized protein n=1 Tax=Mollisia scopiformis TaxID=149040 RepID=A0A194XQ29_MOLSC|nr:uncharacterized protein LY89DRAFT_293004 [Mollisia scopiformis]KUJ22298.1 hypothetical protein LY89DRAFT_293004 [Mollisia scopiformis]